MPDMKPICVSPSCVRERFWILVVSLPISIGGKIDQKLVDESFSMNYRSHNILSYTL